MGGRPSPYGMGYRSPYSMGRAPRGGGFGSPGLLNPQIISIFTNLFLQARALPLTRAPSPMAGCAWERQSLSQAAGAMQMPSSRRAEAQADRIGLKLMLGLGLGLVSFQG